MATKQNSLSLSLSSSLFSHQNLSAAWLCIISAMQSLASRSNNNCYWTCANSNSEIVITVDKLVPSQKLVLDFETTITLNELVQIQTRK